MKYLIRFPIGDWSQDGHNMCDDYYTTSDKPIEDVREAHFKAFEIVGFDIGDICSEYECYALDSNIVVILTALNHPFEDMDISFMTSYDVFRLWVWLLNYIDPQLNLKEHKIMASDMCYCGVDEQGRHLNTPGYGVFLQS